MEVCGRDGYGESKGGDLAEGVNAGVGASGTLRKDGFAGDALDCLSECPLDGRQVWLNLPAVVGRSVVGEGGLPVRHGLIWTVSRLVGWERLRAISWAGLARGDGGVDCGSAGTIDEESVEAMAKRLIYLRHRTRERIFTGDVGNEASNGCVSVLSLNIALISVVVEAGRIRRSLPVSGKSSRSVFKSRWEGAARLSKN